MELVVENEFQTLTAGDRIGCEQFVRDEYEGLFRWFQWLTNCPHRAADLTQETFAAFWASLARKTPDTSPRTWLFAIGRNQWRKDCRDRKSHASNGDEFGDDLVDQISDSGPSPHEIAEHHEFAMALEAEVAKLPDDFREVLTLRLCRNSTTTTSRPCRASSPNSPAGVFSAPGKSSGPV